MRLAGIDLPHRPVFGRIAAVATNVAHQMAPRWSGVLTSNPPVSLG
jgi:hypothetical protein